MSSITIIKDKIKRGLALTQQESWDLYKYIEALEQQPNRCDNCIHSEEQDGSNCYECVKGMADNFEAHPSVAPRTNLAETSQDVIDKIKEEILDEAEYAYADFDKYKEDILYAEPDELPDDDFRYGLRRAVEIINKYKIKE